MKFLSIILFSVFIYVDTAFGSYYIDYINGKDYPTNNGTSKSTPWQHHPYFYNWGGGSGYTHGTADQFIFKGGVTNPASCFPMTILLGGSSGNGDYYGVDQTWYSGSSFTRPIFDGQYAASSLVSLNSGLQYITFDSIEMRHINCTSAYGQAIFGCSFCEYIMMTNCYLHGWLLATNGSGLDGQHGGYFCSHSVGGNIGNLLLGTEVENSENGPSGNWNGVCVFQGDVISNCIIHDNGSLIDQAITVEYSHIYNQGYPYTNFDNQFHLDMIWLSDTTGANPPANGYCHHNYIYNGGFGAGAGLIFSVVPTTTNYIYDNVFFGAINTYPLFSDPSDSYATLTNTIAGTIYYYNNTCANTNSTSYPLWHITQRYNKNSHPVQLANLFITNNIYINISSSWNDAGLTQGNSTWCANYQNGVNLTMTPAVATSDGYVLSNTYAPIYSNSPSVNTGANLTSLGLFTTDILGVSQGSTWDIGAYKYTGNVVKQFGITIKKGGNTVLKKSSNGIIIRHP